MKKLLLSIGFILCLSPAFSQSSLILRYETYNNPQQTTPIPNQPFWVNVNYAGGTDSYQFQTDGSGWFQDTIPHPGVNASVSFITYDCQGNADTRTVTIAPASSYTGDTAILSCQLQLSCQAMIHQKASSGLTINLQDSSHMLPAISFASRVMEWDFGDGNSTMSTDIFGVSHTYAQAGTYNVCLRSYVMDTLYNTVVCDDSVCMTVTVGGGNPTNFCTASYWLDTTSSGGSNVYIVNNSTPAHNDPNYSTSFTWDFGDGNTSHQAYPVHTYANPGEYGVCLTVSSTDNNSNVCTETFCDTLGIDSLGNVLYKSATGFTLNVLDSAGLVTIGLDDAVSGKSVKIYPNPASDIFNISLAGTGNYELSVFDLKGARVKKMSGSANHEEIKLDVSDLEPGVYILSLEAAGGVTQHKLLKD